MPARSIISMFPDELRQWLESEYVRRGFSGYEDLTAALNAKCQELGLKVVSRPTVIRDGQRVEARIAKLKASLDMARVLAREAPDLAGDFTEALQRLVQDKLFETLLAMEDGEEIDPKVLSQIAHAIADSARASVVQRKWQTEAQARAAKVAEEVSSSTKAAGISDEIADQIRRKILGIAA